MPWVMQQIVKCEPDDEDILERISPVETLFTLRHIYKMRSLGNPVWPSRMQLKIAALFLIETFGPSWEMFAEYNCNANARFMFSNKIGSEN